MDRPAINDAFFWDFNLKTLDFQKAYITVISRVLERGTEKDWEEITRFYGYEKVVNTIKNEIPYLPDYILSKVAGYFSIAENEMKCYTLKQSRNNYWI